MHATGGQPVLREHVVSRANECAVHKLAAHGLFEILATSGRRDQRSSAERAFAVATRVRGERECAERVADHVESSKIRVAVAHARRRHTTAAQRNAGNARQCE